MSRIAFAILLTMFPGVAFAHVGVGGTSGFAHGFAHPLSGLDHLLAMIAVGVLAAQLGGRALWLVPLTFMFMMTLAGALGMAGIALPFVEVGIGLSVVVLGIALATQLTLSTVAAAATVGLFGAFHGHAHGAEMPESISGVSYAVGFVSATGVLHALGIGIGLLIGQTRQTYVIRAGGGAVAVAGLILLARIGLS